LTEAQWTEATVFWAQRMGEDAQPDPNGNVHPRIALAFSEAFARAQDAKRPLVQLSVEQWAELVLEIEIEDLGAGPVLARRQLRMADYSRLVRHWAKAIATDPALAKTYADVRSRLGNAEERI
jgi:hypothetical protein